METRPVPSHQKRRRLILGGVGILFFFAAAVGLLRWAAPVPDEGAARAAERLKAWTDLQADNDKKLGTYAVVDEAKGQYQIPIQRAMELTVAELKDHQPKPAGPIATPAASPAASPANSP